MLFRLKRMNIQRSHLFLVTKVRLYQQTDKILRKKILKKSLIVRGKVRSKARLMLLLPM